MTRIEIFGEPKTEIVEALKRSLQKLDIDIPEIYLIFAGTKEEMREYRLKFSKASLCSLEGKNKEIFEYSIERDYNSMVAIYFSKGIRKIDVPPAILLNIGAFASVKYWEDYVFHETLHLKDEIIGGHEIEEKATIEALKNFCILREPSFETIDANILFIISDCISDFFGDEIACQYGYRNYVLENKKRYLQNITATIFNKYTKEENVKIAREIPLEAIELIIRAIFSTSLPPICRANEDERKSLEKGLTPVTNNFEEYIDLKNLITLDSQIKIPPEKTNLLTIYGKIFIICKEFLDCLQK